jgi:hypothetical protein
VVIALVANPTMSGGLGIPFVMTGWDLPHLPSTPWAVWATVVFLIGALFVLTAVLVVPLLIRRIRQRHRSPENEA